MKLSIVIVNYNVKHFLEQCLYSVEKAIKNLDAEVFVVDNNSVDGSIGMLIHKFPNVNLVSNKVNRGFSKANNQAIYKAKGDYILLLNPDTVVEEKTFEKAVNFMDEHEDAGGLGVKMIDGKGQFLPESKRGLPTPTVAFYKMSGLASLFPKSKQFGKYHLSYLDKDENHEVDVLSGAFMLLRKKVIDKIGALDETFFMYGEDIDLSYRITLAGYKNYYFSDTTIIHYKGESTKKSSLNYVKIFYQAMVIFANKHFSKTYAKWFALLINIAIYFRAGIAGIWRVSKKLALPALDFSILYGLLFIALKLWEQNKYYDGYYPAQFLFIIMPIYIIIWQLMIFFSGGYDKPLQLLKIYRGILWGFLLIMAIYAFLPEELRFSRVTLLLGLLVNILGYTIIRMLLSLSRNPNYRIGSELPKKIAIVGFKEESKRVHNLINEIGLKHDLVGFITPKRKFRSERYLGSIYQLKEVLEIHQIDELIFCSADVSTQKMIKSMLVLSSFDVQYKVAAPESIYIIGSNSIDTNGSLYEVHVNAISKESNKRNKRLIDFASSLLFILTLPINIWLVERKSNYLKNLWKVLTGQLSWVGYYPVKEEEHFHLPKIKQGVLTVVAPFAKKHLSSETISNYNTTYARDYMATTDLELIFRQFKQLGQEPKSNEQH